MPRPAWVWNAVSRKTPIWIAGDCVQMESLFNLFLRFRRIDNYSTTDRSDLSSLGRKRIIMVRSNLLT